MTQMTTLTINDLLEDLTAFSSNKYLTSIKKARQEVKRGEVYSHQGVFGKLKQGIGFRGDIYR